MDSGALWQFVLRGSGGRALGGASFHATESLHSAEAALFNAAHGQP